MRLLLRYILFFNLISFASAGTDGTIRGKVSDVDGNPLPGANIYVPDVGIGAAAGGDGSYIILNIPVGDYDVVVQMMGYQKQTMTDVSVMMDQTVWLNFKLPIAAVEGEEVQVLGQRALVEKGSTSKKITVDKEAIQSLPIRDLSELYTLQSGVVKVESRSKSVPDHEERGIEEIHVKGGRSGEIAYMMDGMYLRNPIFGSIGSGTRLNMFAVREFDWQPGGFNAEYGDAQSAISNWHTASGGKEIEYHFKWETSSVGAFLDGDSDESKNYDLNRGYTDYNFGIGGPIIGIPKLTFWTSGQYTTQDKYSVYEFDDKVYQGPKYFLDESDVDDQILKENKKNLVYPWDDQSGFRGFGFDNTWDVFAKLSYKPTNKLRFHASYWLVENHRQSFNPTYLYWDEGRNELFRDTERFNAEMNHTLSQNTFYTLRISRFQQDQFQGVRWRDNDQDGYPNWFEWRHSAGFKEISDIENEYVVPYSIGEDGDTIRYTNIDERSGWYYGAEPGLWNWEMAEDFDDLNGNGIWDIGENFEDLNNDSKWNGPELIKKLKKRDGSYWLEPEMYEDYEPFLDHNSIDLLWQNVPGYYGTPNNFSFIPGRSNPYYYMPDASDVAWDEGRTFGGHDTFYASSTAITDEIRFDITSQLSEKWKIRTGFDYKSHKLNFYEVKQPWLGAGAKIQTFAEYWQDTGPDGLLLGDEGYETADAGESNGRWDEGEKFTDANSNGKWDDFREPEELSAYIQNVFEVPWMVINYGVRIDMVHYNSQVWSDTTGKFSPGRPWFYSDLNDNDKWDENELASDIAGLARQKILLKNSNWSYKISPRIGFSHVITDKSTFTFNYGLYYQNPVYQNVYLNTNSLEDPETLFEEGEGAVGNATMNAQRTQQYGASFNVQVGENWAYSLGAWVRDMDQLTRYTQERSGVYQYSVASNGDYGSAKGLDLTIDWRWLLFGSQFQYTYSVAKTNSEYAWASISGQYVDAPSQENLAYYDRPHDLTYYFYTFLPFGVQAGLTAFYQSGYPYTPIVFRGKDPVEDLRQPNSKRGPAYKNVNLSFAKYFERMDHKFSVGLNIFNVLDIRNAYDIYALTGKADDPGTYYTDYVGLPGTDPNGVGVYANKSSAYYDRPWRMSPPREINFFIRIDFE
jgi:hypothetical protein